MSDKTPIDKIKSLTEAAIKVTNGIPDMPMIQPNQGGGGMPSNMNDLTATSFDPPPRPPGLEPKPTWDPSGVIPPGMGPWMDYWGGPPPKGPFAKGGIWRKLWENSSPGAQGQIGGWIVI